MKYDLSHLYGCGGTHISQDLPGDHQVGDVISIKCGGCGTVGEHEVRGRLEGLEA